MADRSVDTTDTLEAFRTTFNSTAADVGDIADLNVQFAGTPSDLVEGVNSKAHYTGQNTIVTVGTITTGTWEATDVGVSHGGTGASTAADARTNLGVVIGSDVQAWDAQLDDIAALAVTDGNIIVGDGTNWVAESGATARTSLGVAIGSDVQAWDAQLDDIAALAVTDGNIIVGDGTNWVAESGATARASLGLIIGTDVQAYDAELAALAGLTSATDKGIQFTGSGTAATYDLTAAGKALLDDADAAAQLVTLGLTATAAELNTLDGITATVTELNYTDGVTSAIQTQLDAKAPLASPAFTGTATGVNLTLSGDLTVNGTTTTLNTTNTVVSDNLIELNNGVASNANDSGIVIERGSTGDNAFMGWDESADEFILGTTTATGSSTGDLTITAAPLSISALTLGGTVITSTGAELNYVDGVTSNIQTQLDAIISSPLVESPSGTFTLTGDLVVSGNVTSQSDETLKENIKEIEGALEKITKLSGRTFVMKSDESKKENIGFIAQELEQHLPQVVFTDPDGIKSVSYGNVTAILVEAIKELHLTVEELKNRK